MFETDARRIGAWEGRGAEQHQLLESFMLRFACLLALGCLAVAATAHLTTPTTAAEEPRLNREPVQVPRNRCLVLTTAPCAPFHLPFSMN
jgi:hypothetical protein